MASVRLYINPALFDAVESFGHPQRVIARVAGVRADRLSALMRARSVPATAINVEHLEEIARVIKFDDRLFVGRTPPDHTYTITASISDAPPTP